MRMEREMNTPSWLPPSDSLQCVDGIWRPASIGAVSYPEEGNELCFQVEDESYWFAHRNRCIMELMRHYPPKGVVYDVGGGNGFVSIGMQRAGHVSVLVEPGPGALNARKRGLHNVVQSTLEAAIFRERSIDAIGAFDVLEHIEEDARFLMTVRHLLRRNGRFYCTVPALRTLWSHEDEFAGHYRRYSEKGLRAVIEGAGMEVEFISCIFLWVAAPLYMFRTLPWRFGWRKKPEALGLTKLRADHTLPAIIAPLVARLNDWEIGRLSRRKAIPFGTSVVCVARST